MKRLKLKTKFTPEEIAVVSLDSYKSQIENDKNIHQVTFNIVTDKLRRYLGESSKIYSSFAAIDISIQDEKKSERIENAVRLLKAAISIIESNGLYKDLQMQMLEVQIKDIKSKSKFAALSAIGATFLTLLVTYAKEIGRVVLKLLHLQQP